MPGSAGFTRGFCTLVDSPGCVTAVLPVVAGSASVFSGETACPETATAVRPDAIASSAAFSVPPLGNSLVGFGLSAPFAFWAGLALLGFSGY
ncbi:MAG: hypothetical protein LZF84_02090, partial [Nitrosomonas sp.]